MEFTNSEDGDTPIVQVTAKPSKQSIIGERYTFPAGILISFRPSAEFAYFASTVRLFRFSGLPVRFKRSEIIGEAAKLESQYFRCPGLQQPKPLQAGIHPI